jgi:hypothetical protein
VSRVSGSLEKNVKPSGKSAGAVAKALCAVRDAGAEHGNAPAGVWLQDLLKSKTKS